MDWPWNLLFEWKSFESCFRLTLNLDSIMNLLNENYRFIFNGKFSFAMLISIHGKSYLKIKFISIECFISKFAGTFFSPKPNWISTFEKKKFKGGGQWPELKKLCINQFEKIALSSLPPKTCPNIFVFFFLSLFLLFGNKIWLGIPCTECSFVGDDSVIFWFLGDIVDIFISFDDHLDVYHHFMF